MILDEATYRYADTKYIYYPGDSEFSVSDFSVNLSIEECSTIQFTIYPEHPYYNDFIIGTVDLESVRGGIESLAGDCLEGVKAMLVGTFDRLHTNYGKE